MITQDIKLREVEWKYIY